MIDISTALQNILKAVYGRDVRESIHDAIYQINANANEAIDLAQIKFGTAVNSPTDPIAGFTENTLYLNINTNIMWKLEGGSWTKKGTFKSIDSISLASTSGSIDTYTITFTDGSTSNFNVKNGADGIDGKSITGITKTSTSGKIDHYDINLSDGTTISGFDVTNGSDGADGKSIANISLASTSGNVKTYDVLLDDGTKTPTGFSVEDGASSYLHIRYSSSFDGTGMVTTPTDATVYIGILVSTSSVAPTNPSLYNWVRFIGKSGTGSGDMLAADYATRYPKTVDKAAALYDGTDEILANQLMKNSQYDADDDGVVDLAKNANKALNANNAEVADNATHALMSEKAWGLESSDGTYSVSAKEANDMYDCFHKEGADLKLSDSALSSAVTTKLPKSVPTTADEGKAPVVQSDGTVDWQKVSGSGTARIDISHTADDVYYYNLSEPTKQILVTGTSIDVGFGTYRFYQTDGSQKSEEQEVIVDTLKIYSVELSYFTAYITVNYPSYAKCLLTKGTTSINASNGVATVVPSDGVWSVKVYATNTAGEEVIGETSTVTIATDGQSETLTLNGLAKINLTWLSGFDSAITIENSAKGITYNGLLSGTSIIIPVNALGDWIIYGTHTGKQYKAKVTISSFGEEKSVYLKTSTTYAVHISMTEADPDNAATFPSGYDNSDFSDNAYMDFTGGSFHYGNWADAFFMPRSCMLKFDGTVDYYLNEDDETKKEDGTASDVANMSYGGNAMVEWGKIYFGFKGDADGNGYTFIVSDYSDEGIDCYCNIDENKNEIDHFYTPKYFGSNDSSNRLRSISGQSNYVSQTGTTELSHAKANGNGWSTECYGDWTLIKHLLVLMSKSLNTQGKYGYGRCSTSNSSAIGQGTMNGKGRFWGDSSQTNGVKIFGMENWYGNIWRRIEGYVTNSSGVQLVKMCYGTRDGSTADGYSTGGTGYVSMGTTSGTSGSGIQSMHINDKCGVVPKALTGNTSPTTYFSDGNWYGNSCYALVGGSWHCGLRVGAFSSLVSSAVSSASADFGAAVSCKPLSA